MTSFGELGLAIDLYELTMAESYLREGMFDEAIFSLFVRKLPKHRNYLVACGLGRILQLVEELRFDTKALAALARMGLFSKRLLDWLAQFHFSGSIRAVAEGTPLFPDEPLLEVCAPLPEAQLLETAIVNTAHLATVQASKATRVVAAAAGRRVVDFGLRRAHGWDAGLSMVYAGYLVGMHATSNVLAGQILGVPITGTMAHSYIQAHPSELEAFVAFSQTYPETVLLVDTYDTLAGVRRVIELAARMGPRFRVSGIRIDSGDLAALSLAARHMLDRAGLHEVTIFASGGLDEWEIARLVAAGAPIDGFGVGTRMAVSEDAPSLDMAYKLVRYAGVDRLKLSPGKRLLPGAKQIYRQEAGETAVEDTLACEREHLAGTPLLHTVMDGGERTTRGRCTLEQSRAYHRKQLARLPESLRQLTSSALPYPVNLSKALRAQAAQMAEPRRAANRPRLE